MRDPKRIEPILAAIRQLWLTNPDLRLCQLVHNAVAAADPRWHGKDQFHVEDNVVLDGLKKLSEGTQEDATW